MKKFLLFLSSVAVLCACSREPRAEHVIILGFDAMSARGIQRAETPTFNYMIDNGAVSLNTRCVRQTASSQNWMSMVSGAPIEQHGVFSNGWMPGLGNNLPPTQTNNIGLFPTIFDQIRAQKPSYKQYAYVEWDDEVRMYDTSAFDKCCVMGTDPDLKVWQDVMDKAFKDYLEDRPEMLFVSVDQTDHAGHSYGHESDGYLNCITECDAKVGEFLRELERRGWMKNTVIIITADHGGIKYGHGDDSLSEFEIPVILYGKGVTKGKVMRHSGMIYDVAATAATLLGIKLPFECHGKLFTEAFEPRTADDVYVPMPMVRPFDGRAEGDITITADAPDAEIYYTLDGSEPTEESTHYDGPFQITGQVVLRSVAYRHGVRGAESANYLYNGFSGNAPVAYRMYLNYKGEGMPDFTKMGKPSATGYVDNFYLEEFPELKDADHFAIEFTSNCLAPLDGEYTLELCSDDGAILYVDGKPVIKNAGAHSSDPAYGTVSLTRGQHTIKVDYYEDYGDQTLSVKVNDGGFFRPFRVGEIIR